jgi:hypothetical protein
MTPNEAKIIAAARRLAYLGGDMLETAESLVETHPELVKQSVTNAGVVLAEAAALIEEMMQEQKS